MFVSESMYELGSKRSAIRELFEYGKKRAAIVGAENVYDFSLGNPTVPAPDCVNETIRELTQSLDSISLHGYTSAQGDLETRQAIADYLNNTYETNFKADNLYMTMGAAASLSIAFTPQALAQGRSFLAMASYGQTDLHFPHLMHFSWLIMDLPFTMLIAPFGQTSLQGCATQPLHILETSYIFVSQASQAEGITCISGGS